MRRALGTAAILLLIACKGETPSATETQPPVTASPTSTPTPSRPAILRERHRTAEFDIFVPAGWQKYREGTEPRLVGYSDGKGMYIKVLVWEEEPGFGYSSDATWILDRNAAGDGFVVRSKGKPCKRAGALCTTGNGQLEIYALIKGEEAQIRRRYFQFEFGFTHAETGVDTTVFEAIIESFRAR